MQNNIMTPHTPKKVSMGAVGQLWSCPQPCTPPNETDGGESGCMYKYYAKILGSADIVFLPRAAHVQQGVM